MSSAPGFAGVAAGALTLIALEVAFTASQNGSSGLSRIASLARAPGRLAASWLDPAVPLIPDLARAKSKGPAGGGGSAPPASGGAHSPAQRLRRGGPVPG